MTTYTTRGSVCGGCDHKHGSLRAAHDCLKRHQNAIARHNTRGAYSDRQVVRVDGVRLDDHESEELFAIAYGDI